MTRKYLLPVVLACSILMLSGCHTGQLESDGPLFSENQSSSPLKDGSYIILSRNDAGSFESHGQWLLLEHAGKYWIDRPDDAADKKPSFFHLYRITDDRPLYIMQTDDDTMPGKRALYLVEIPESRRACVKDISPLLLAGATVKPGDQGELAITDKRAFVGWLVQEANNVLGSDSVACFVQLT